MFLIKIYLITRFTRFLCVHYLHPEFGPRQNEVLMTRCKIYNYLLRSNAQGFYSPLFVKENDCKLKNKKQHLLRLYL